MCKTNQIFPATTAVTIYTATTAVTIYTARYNIMKLCFLFTHRICAVRKILKVNISNNQTQCVYCEVGNGLTWASCLDRSVPSFSQRWPGFEPRPEQVGSVVDKYACEATVWVLLPAVKVFFTEGQTGKALGPFNESNAISEIEELSLFVCRQEDDPRRRVPWPTRLCESLTHACATFSVPIGFHRPAARGQ